MKTLDGYHWVDHLIENHVLETASERSDSRRCSRWRASRSSAASSIRIPSSVSASDDDKPDDEEQQKPPRKGFTPQEAKRVLTVTFVAPSDFISVEMAAARRWLPWLCACSGARVNELTSQPTDRPDLVLHRYEPNAYIWAASPRTALMASSAGFRRVAFHISVVSPQRRSAIQGRSSVPCFGFGGAASR